jgi:hypothetical protein
MEMPSQPVAIPPWGQVWAGETSLRTGSSILRVSETICKNKIREQVGPVESEGQR